MVEPVNVFITSTAVPETTYRRRESVPTTKKTIETIAAYAYTSGCGE
jgi:hypothetical protein